MFTMIKEFILIGPYTVYTNTDPNCKRVDLNTDFER